MIEAVQTALDALKTAIEAGEVAAGVKAVADYKASVEAPQQPAQGSDAGTPAADQPAQGGEAEAPATALYTQQQYDDGIAAQKQSDQAMADAATAKADQAMAQVAQLKEDIKAMGDDFAKLQKDAE